MKVVVVGCNGFIGKSLMKELNKLEIDHLGLSKEEYDLSKVSTATKLKKILNQDDKIVFTSAIAPAKSIEDLQNSIKMAEIFCKSIKDLSVNQILLISSDAVYGDRNGLINEFSPCNPNTFHGLSQLAREVIFSNARCSALAILRLCAVYGEGDTHNGYGPNRFLNQIRNSETIKVFGKGLNTRDHIHINDVAELAIRCLNIDFSGTLNLASGESNSFMNVAEKCRIAFSPRTVIEKIGDEGEIFYKNYDISKMSQIFPDFNPMTLDYGLNLWKKSVKEETNYVSRKDRKLL